MTGRGLILATVSVTGKEHLEGYSQRLASCCDRRPGSRDKARRHCVLPLGNTELRGISQEALKDVFAQVFVFHYSHQPLFHRFGIKHDVLVGYVWQIEQKVFK